MGTMALSGGDKMTPEIVIQQDLEDVGPWETIHSILPNF